MDVTKLFEVGHLPYKIVEFTKFSMKQVCKPKKKEILMLTLNTNISTYKFFKLISIHFRKELVEKM